MGNYGFVATRSAVVGSSLAFTGAFSGAAAQGSQTPAGLPAAAYNGLGGAVTGAATSEPFSRVGVLFADGLGGLYADVPSTELAPKVGSYSVHDDCSVSMTLDNKYAFTASANAASAVTAKSPNHTTQPAPAPEAFSNPSTVAFQGVILQRGEDVELVQTGGPGGTLFGMRKIFAPDCNNDHLNDTFGLIGVGSRGTLSSGPAFTAFGISGRLIGDGLGHLITDGFSLSSPMAQQLTGTYTVNLDCTGSAKIAMGDGTSATVNFVLVHEYNAAVGTAAPQIHRKRLMFAVTGQGVAGTGFATAQ